MPISNVTQWSATAASNVDIGGISLDGAVMTPSQVDNAIRELMAQVAGGISASYFLPSSPVLTLPQINDTSADHQYVFAVSELSADRTVTLPLLTGNDTFVFAAFTQTLTNKTLTSPTINSPTVTGLDASTTVKGISEFATAAEFRTGTDTARSLVVSEAWAAAVEVSLTDAATIAVDMSTFINASVTIAGNRTLGNPTLEKLGQTGYIRIRQDATGGRTLAYGSEWRFAGGVAPTLSTGPGVDDMLFYTVYGIGFVLGTLVKAVG